MKTTYMFAHRCMWPSAWGKFVYLFVLILFCVEQILFFFCVDVSFVTNCFHVLVLFENLNTYLDNTESCLIIIISKPWEGPRQIVCNFHCDNSIICLFSKQTLKIYFIVEQIVKKENYQSICVNIHLPKKDIIIYISK